MFGRNLGHPDLFRKLFIVVKLVLRCVLKDEIVVSYGFNDLIQDCRSEGTPVQCEGDHLCFRCMRL